MELYKMKMKDMDKARHSKKTFWQYWRIVIDEAWKNAWNELGMWGIIIPAIAGLGAMWWSNKEKPLSEIFGGDWLMGFIWFILVYMLVIAFFILREPNIINNRQMERLDRYESSPVDVKLLVYPDSDTIHFQKVGIRIINPTSVKTTNVKVELNRENGLKWIPLDKQLISKSMEILDSNRTFITAEGFDGANTILPNREVFVYIAEIREHKIVWLLKDQMSVTNDKYYEQLGKSNNQRVSQFRLDLRINGIFDDRPIITQNYSVLVGFHLKEDTQDIPVGVNWYYVDEPVTISTVKIIEQID